MNIFTGMAQLPTDRIEKALEAYEKDLGVQQSEAVEAQDVWERFYEQQSWLRKRFSYEKFYLTPEMRFYDRYFHETRQMYLSLKALASSGSRLVTLEAAAVAFVLEWEKESE